MCLGDAAALPRLRVARFGVGAEVCALTTLCWTLVVVVVVRGVLGQLDVFARQCALRFIACSLENPSPAFRHFVARRSASNHASDDKLDQSMSDSPNGILSRYCPDMFIHHVFSVRKNQYR